MTITVITPNGAEVEGSQFFINEESDSGSASLQTTIEAIINNGNKILINGVELS